MPEYHVIIPKEEYSMFEFTQRDLPGFAVVNVALKNFEPKIVFAWHLSVLIECQDLVLNRLPSPEEQKLLYDFEDQLDPAIKANGNALFLARVTHDARRELMWRVYDPEVANQFLQKMIQNKNYPRPFDYRIDEDTTWSNAEWYLSRAGIPGTDHN